MLGGLGEWFCSPRNLWGAVKISQVFVRAVKMSQGTYWRAVKMSQGTYWRAVKMSQGTYWRAVKNFRHFYELLFTAIAYMWIDKQVKNLWNSPLLWLNVLQTLCLWTILTVKKGLGWLTAQHAITIHSVV